MAVQAESPVALPAATQLASWRREARLFRRLRWQMLRGLARTALATARVQVASVVFASTVLWGGLFGLFFEGFAFIQKGLPHDGLRAQLVHAVFNIFFLALAMMLTFSSAIILYGGLYRSEETAFLLSTPTRDARIVMYKFQEAVFFSCWGFVLLGSPMLLAYGLVAEAPWYYYVLLPPLVFSFVVVPTAVGAIGCLLAVRLLPRLRMHALALLAAIALAVALAFGWRVLAYENADMTTPHWFQDVLARLQFSEQRLLPSWWLSSGLLEAAHPAASEDGAPSWVESIMFLGVLASNALLLLAALDGVAALTFRSGFSGLRGLGSVRRAKRPILLDRLVLFLGRPLPRVIRHFIVKDLRLFRRDPAQWSQFLIFFGLLSLYFFNVRRFDYAGAMERWVLIVSFLNLAVVGLILSTFTTRFIFPLISMEGRRFWILATAPIDRDSILWGKFCFSCAASWPPCALLVLLSDLTLGVAARSMAVVWLHQFACAVLCLGLSALAVGLGARLPNLREPSPSKIAAGFGGTLNLVLSALFIIAVVSATAAPTCLWLETPWAGLDVRAASGRPGGGWLQSGEIGVAGGILLTALLGLAATVLPLRIGLRWFRQLEY